MTIQGSYGPNTTDKPDYEKKCKFNLPTFPTDGPPPNYARYEIESSLTHCGLGNHNGQRNDHAQI
jgi:hypothetical protein